MNDRRVLPPPSRRRDKPQLSCNLCRRRKLRCDRGQPCGSCVHRDLSHSCTYLLPNANGPSRVNREQRSGTISGLTERIGQLEGLISSLVDNASDGKAGQTAGQMPINLNEDIQGSTRAKAGARSGSQPSQPSDSFGHISLRHSKTTYVEDTHWTAILDEMSELKSSARGEDSSGSHHETSPGRSSDLLFSDSRPANLKEILKGLPSRQVADRLVASYFSCKILPPYRNSDPRPVIFKTCKRKISVPAWKTSDHETQYEKFWEKPLETPIMWIGKLYGVLCLAIHFQYQATPGFEVFKDQIEAYTEKVNQCLILGRYQECPPDTIETLCCSLHAQFLQRGDSRMDDLIFLGLVVRTAQRMGYHRDASHFPHISPFQGEMRRRVWALITDLDTLVSTQVGLPRTLREFQSDTAPPRNLLDEDFDEDTTELPPSRPSSFETPCQWLVVKNKLISMFGIITDFSTSIQRPAYGEVMRLDKLVRDAYTSSPPNFLEKPLNRSLIDSSDIILRRIQLILLLEKALCVLHYRYLAPARVDEQFAYSRNTCIESSLHMLEYHWIVEQESKFGGSLFEQRWKISTPLFKSQWILATTLLCLEMNYDLLNESAEDSRWIPLTDNTRERIVQCLQKAYQVFSHSKDELEDSSKTLQALKIVFQKMGKHSNHKYGTVDPVESADRPADVGRGSGVTTSNFFPKSSLGSY
ncbi:hypothetical protein N7532_009575 [Penicillium argentinense]|uniref:Zn(2)-C6 fungal-type domain-containing protein n=1 Tax=Penicillium argentinense TaxID=1131581 RepID=A0A9W9EZU6_9EURO|nr:uncharacterized protein N7532_009575 [Penicillium argentinense]KAJ5090891.1 hypothetical protein N7532_009575 [Penicillium argentinense]